MKKLILLFSCITIFSAVHAQDAFYKNALVVSLGFGGEAYNITETYGIEGLMSPINYTTSTGVGSIAFPLMAEYGVNKWLGLGLEGKLDNYIIQKNSATGFQPTAVGFEFGAVVNFHVVRTRHVDFFLGLDPGISHFTYTIDANSDQVYGNGGWGDIHTGVRYYFGRFGINANLGFPTMNYNLTSNVPNVSLGENVITTWKAKGAAFGIGIQYRFLKPAGGK